MRSPILQNKRPGNAVAWLSRKLIVFALVILLLSWPLPDPAEAAAGDLDNTFGSGGKVTTNFQFSGEAFGVAIQTDGKIVAAGFTSGLGPSSFALVRYNTNGTLDASFGTGGMVTTGFDLGSGAADLAIQTDGKIVAVGTAFSNSSDSLDFALVRYNTDGSLDSTFGSDGKVTTDFFGSTDQASAIAIQADGKIVLGGSAADPAPPRIDFALARYNADGSLDFSFGSGGKVTTDFFGDNDFPAELALQPDGKLIAAGIAFSPNNSRVDYALARYNTEGSLDSTFGSGGKVTTSFGIDDGGAAAMGLQFDGKIVVAGNSFSTSTGGDFAVLRYNTDGTLDPTFGSGGKVTTDILGSADQARALAIYPNGKIVVGGTALNLTSHTNHDFGLVRYNTDGSLDTMFGSGGKVTTDFSGDDFDSLNDLIIQSDGKIVAVGGAMIASRDFALARYKGNDVSFDICIQDDSNGNILKFNSTTGEYQFTKCGSGLVLDGTGSLTRKGGTITLQHYATDRRVLARVDGSVNKGTASIQGFSPGTTFTITDRNTSNNICACP